MDYSEQLYFRDLDKHQVLTLEEEVALIRKVKKGDQKAINKLILGNLRFVVSIARKYQGRGLTLLELINEGNMGLHKAAIRFDPSKEVKFISYAVWWIRQNIQKAIFDQVGAIRIPLNKLALINKFKKALAANNGNHEKTLEEEPFKGYRQDIVEIMQKVTDVSLDAPFDSSQNNTLMDVLGDDGDQIRNSESQELKSVLEKILNQMTDVEQKVLRMYYGLNYSREFTLDEIGKELKLTRERVRQIKNIALRKILHSKDTKDKLSPFVTTTGKSAFEGE